MKQTEIDTQADQGERDETDTNQEREHKVSEITDQANICNIADSQTDTEH